MKWVVALLLLANVAFYLWVNDRSDGGEQVLSAQPEVNREGMLLLNELGAGSPAPVASTTKTAAAKKLPAADSPAPAGVAPAELACYRIGPFKQRTGWLAANQWMKSRQFAYNAVRSVSREMRAIRVYLGPFESPAAAQSVMNWLTEREIEHFTDPGEAGQVRVSLGYFTQEALAVKFVAHLLSQGVEASSRPEYRAMGPFDWMEAAINPARGDQLLSHNWRGEKGVAVLEIPCDEIAPPPGKKAP